jgi:hypothetical protein
MADKRDDGHDKKRPRKPYRDCKAWSYNASTPSPEKDACGVEDEAYHMEATPSRPTQLPHTPVSPQRPAAMSIPAGLLALTERTRIEDGTLHQPAALPLHNQPTRNAGAIADATPTANDDSAPDDDYYN